MSGSRGALVIVQGITIARLVAALAFASLALQPIPVEILAVLYVFAAATDVIDGFIARKTVVSSFAGMVLDLVSDKSLTVVSLLYAAARGVPILPLAIVVVRELIVLGLRIVDGKPVLATNRMFGGMMAIGLWGNTLVLLTAGSEQRWFDFIVATYWLLAVIIGFNLAIRLSRSRHQIMDALRAVPRRD